MAKRQFSVLECMRDGLNGLRLERAIYLRLIPFPALILFATMVLLDVLRVPIDSAWLIVARVPADYIKGILCALFVRHLVLRQSPEFVAHDRTAQEAVSQSALLAAVVSFLFGSLFMGMRAVYGETGETATGVRLAVSLSVLGAFVWGFRFQLWPVCVAAGLAPVTVAKWLARDALFGLRIVFVWMLASLPVMILITTTSGMLESIARMAGADMETGLSGPSLWLLFLINAGLDVVLALFLTAASVSILRQTIGKGLS